MLFRSSGLQGTGLQGTGAGAASGNDGSTPGVGFQRRSLLRTASRSSISVLNCCMSTSSVDEDATRPPVLTEHPGVITPQSSHKTLSRSMSMNSSESNTTHTSIDDVATQEYSDLPKFTSSTSCPSPGKKGPSIAAAYEQAIKAKVMEQTDEIGRAHV